MPSLLKASGRSAGRDLRHSAAERRDEVLRAAVDAFAIHGLYGTSTEMIAKRTGISQPYIFRLFPSKKDLFLAAEAAFRKAAENPDVATASHHLGGSPADRRLHAMGHAYVRLVAHRELLLFQMQAYAACADDEIRRKVKQRWERLMKVTAELSGASRDELTLYFARGMLLNVVASIGLVPEGAADAWGHKALGIG